ncbi:hypothetical protein HZB01_05715 [Candidatus Woesearchaeota archaeon]|nr:hypothetical protein [Candidatus Woesearchaeota archaeon]
MPLKLAITIFFVLLLSLLAEYVSPKVSGIISGIPTGTAILLFFYALEQGTAFSVQSAVFNVGGIVAVHMFIYLYYLCSKNNSKSNILFSTIAATSGYLAVSFIVRQIPFTLCTAILIPLVSIPLFSYLLKRIENTTIEQKIQLTPQILLIRVLVASVIITIITEIAGLVGPAWAGILSVFPTTVLPLVLIIHATYGQKQVHTILKHIPLGQWSVVMYVISVTFAYPAFGVYWGTILAYCPVAVYLFVLWKWHQRKAASLS